MGDKFAFLSGEHVPPSIPVDHNGFSGDKGPYKIKKKVPIDSMVARQDVVAKEIVDEYADKYSNKHYVDDGHHRVEGAIKSGRKSITAWVREGER